MLYAGLDFGSQESFLHVMNLKGKMISGSRAPMTRAALDQAFGRYLDGGVCVAMEADGVTRWVHDYLCELGVREIYVVNPNKVRLIAESRKKTDKVDARLLAELYRLDGLPDRVHMPSPPARELRLLIKARNGLVEARTKLLNTARGFLRGQGVHLPSRYLVTVSHWEDVRGNSLLDDAALMVLANYRASFLGLAASLKEIEAEIKVRAKADMRVENLRSVPGIGIHSAVALVSAVDVINRFGNGKRLASYRCLVPNVRNSGERQMSGRIKRQGRSEVRRTFVQAAHVLAISRSHAARPLQRRFEEVRARRGYKTAIVALARRLVTICFYLLRDGSEYDPTRLRV